MGCMQDGFAGFAVTEVSGVPVLWRRDRRYKTFRFLLQATRPLDDRAAARSLLPSLLLQGTQRDRDRPALARRMEGLYGAAVVPGTHKIGETHVLRYSLDSIAGAHAPGQPDLLAAGLEFLADFVERPLLAGADLPEAVFERERVQTIHAVRAIFNDKGQYAALRALQLACEGEPMAIPEHGDLASIEAVRQADVDAARLDFTGRGVMCALAYGALPDDPVRSIEPFLSRLPAGAAEPVPDPAQPPPRPRRAHREVAAVQQGKLVLIYRLPPSDDAERWAARILFTSMLGGGPHSRLFREVREKQSLAYYASAGLERHKGLLQVHTGLDESAAERVEAEVQRQIDQLSRGEFTDEELHTARLGVLSTLQALEDSVGERLEFTARQWRLGHDRTPQQQAELYLGLDREAVAASMQGVWLDYSYLLAAGTAGGAS